MDLSPIELQQARVTLEAAGILGSDLDTSLTTVLRLTTDDTTWTAWRHRIASMSDADLTAEYGHDAIRAVRAIDRRWVP